MYNKQLFDLSSLYNFFQLEIATYTNQENRIPEIYSSFSSQKIDKNLLIFIFLLS